MTPDDPASLQNLALFFNLSLDLMAVIGLDGYFKQINPAFSRTLGYSEAEFLALPFLDFVHPDDHQASRAELEKLQQGVPTLHFENRYRTKDGRYRWLSWSASPQLERGELYCVARDVTRQKQTEAALRESEERWQLALLGSNDGIWDWNVQTNEVFFSTRWKTMLGHEEDEIGSDLDEWASRVHPEDLEWVMQLIQAHFDRKTPFYSSEHRVRCKDGTYKWILDRGQAIWGADGQVLRMVGSHTDITDQRELELALQQANQELERRVAERTAQLARANAALADSEERNRLAMEVAQMFSFEWNPATDEVKRSAQCGPMLGLSATEAERDTGASFFQRVHPQDRDSFVAGILALTPEHNSYKTTYRVIRPDGQTVVLEESGRALFNAEGKRVRLIGMTVDITERQHLQMELEASQAALQQRLAEIETIYQSAPIGLNVLDRDLRFVRINQRLAEINGFSVEDHIGRTIGELLPDMAATAEALLHPILETGEPLLNVEIQGETPAQPGVKRIWRESFFPLKDGDRVIGINTVCEEITERKRTEEALRLSEERYRTLFETMEDGFCVIEMVFDQANTPVDYRFVELNPAFERHTGLHQAEGKTARELLPDLEEHWFHIYGQVALTGEPVRFENGSEVMNRWFEVYAFPVDAPEQYRVALLFKEISDRKAIETQREHLLHQEQAAREAAEQANRVKDEFLAILSHELRTPLNPILGWAKLLQGPQVSSEKLHQGLAAIERNARQQVQLIEDLLDISRIIRGQLSLTMAPVHLDQPIIAALETMQLAADAKAIQVEVRLDPQIGPIRGDASRLQQVIWNLLSNAIKFTPSSGRVTVQLTQEGNHAQIQVKDTGKGIHPSFLSQAFELFKQEDSSLSRAFGGLGLGLAIARQVVEAHGGTITAASAGENQGTTLTVRLPLITGATPRVPDSAIAPPLELPNLRVLAVDDETDSLELLIAVLEEAGARVEAFSSAVTALDMLAQDSFDVLISDIGMPDMDGYTFVSQVRALPPQCNPQVPAIALTAFAGETNRQQVLAAGFQTHLAKPINPQDLLTAIAALVHRVRFHKTGG